MMVDLNTKEKELLITELEETTIPELRVLIASKMRMDSREELKQDEVVLKACSTSSKKRPDAGIDRNRGICDHTTSFTGRRKGSACCFFR